MISHALDWQEDPKNNNEIPSGAIIKGPTMPPADYIFNNNATIAENDKQDTGNSTSETSVTFALEPINYESFTFNRKDKNEKKKSTEAELMAILNERELNPTMKRCAASDISLSTIKTVSRSKVGDSGLQWHHRAYERCKQQAKDEQRPLDEIVSERYGSMDKLLSLINEAEDLSDDRHHSRHRSSRQHDHRSSTFLRPKQHDDYRTSSSSLAALSTGEDKQGSWRKRKAEEEIDDRSQKHVHHEKEPDINQKQQPKVEDELISEENLIELRKQLIRAELRDDEEMSEQLRIEIKRIDDLRSHPQASEHNPLEPPETQGKKVLVLTTIDRYGVEKPVHDSHTTHRQQSTKHDRRRMKKEVKKLREQDKDPEREGLTLTDLVEQERFSTNNYSPVMPSSRTTSHQSLSSDRHLLNSTRHLQGWARIHALADQRKRQQTFEQCWLCIENLSKEYIFGLREHWYLCAPPHQSLIDGHCFIAPIQHTSSRFHLDEDVLTELDELKSMLTGIFRDVYSQVPIFIETFKNPRLLPHMYIECIPIPYDQANLVPMYFRKALLECESMWAQNKKLIEIQEKSSRALKQVVPKGLPYFCVEFPRDKHIYGFAHVIEDRGQFSLYFGREILGGLLHVDNPQLWRKPGKESEENIKLKYYIYNDQNDDGELIDIGIRLKGNNQDFLVADLIAEERDMINTGSIKGLDLYHFQIQRKRSSRSKRSIDDLVNELMTDDRVEHVYLGKTLERQKREFIDEDELEEEYRRRNYRKWNDNEYVKRLEDEEETQKKNLFDSLSLDQYQFKMKFDDEFYRKQWYLENEGQMDTPANHDINVIPAWLAGYSGKNVTICIVDDGLDHSHPELKDRYLAHLSYDLNDLNDSDHDPAPRTNDSANNHGTRCGGAAAGEANNHLCGVGVAYGSYISAIRLLDGRITTLLEARSLTFKAVEISIKSASWGPTDDGTKMEAPGTLVNAALDYGVQHGRNGKGLLFVWASGNGGAAGDDCSADGYVSHQNVISIGSINHLGKTTYFGEFCPSTMAVAYTGGRHAKSGQEKYLPVGVVAADVGGQCTTKFFGTSGAAPVAAGAFALVLEANPDLTYRDVMHIIAETARIPNLSETDDWFINGAGFHISDKFGFGVLDVGQMIAKAQNWTNVQPRCECYHEYTELPIRLPPSGVIKIHLDVLECINVTVLEHVVANISFTFNRRGNVKITLISPSQTPSEMLSFRPNDATNKGINYFPFLTAHKWGESPIGRWVLLIETRRSTHWTDDQDVDGGALTYFGLKMYGSTTPDSKLDRSKRSGTDGFRPSDTEIEWIYKRELSIRDKPNVLQSRQYQQIRSQNKRTDEIKKDEQEGRSVFSSFQRIFHF
ncbi:unnamed protein product [Didymodactylos carnosus]|uniref:P/Homo B domain-containing protein n=1 Tax=Didymodactylos carnosus TaxID=1234261 RepID=A0A813T868_9BILA|nr:unnamed protein product [Didymodactylos carnosus]CAF0833748.1 unnamed protein product [Didymodactylos carnosus]CAF3591489.1 unnamed protein product [Didymodactylos carnosus]CAF3618422.1 unnamed protein product [Didymodactylos carnosus]